MQATTYILRQYTYQKVDENQTENFQGNGILMESEMDLMR